MNRFPVILAAAIFAAAPVVAVAGELSNITVVTDANPNYSDMESMVHSITSNWKTDQEKMWALFYWDHIARRQTQPMYLHGFPLTDPIRQYNDYGYTMCSTISGIKCSTWNYMGYPCRYFDISNHTVPEVWYAGRFHLYDNSLSMIYTLTDGKTIAGVADVGKMGTGPETGGKEVPGYIALYHALTGTSPNGFCEGADDARPLSQIVEDFNPAGLKYRFYYYDQDRGHRYILNLRDGEVYARYYSRQDANSPKAVAQGNGYKADPAYYVPNGGQDPEAANPRYRIRGNGERTWTPLLDAAHVTGELYSSTNIKATDAGLTAADPAKPAEAIFKVEGANVITSLQLHAATKGSVSFSLSTTNGLKWQDVWNLDDTKSPNSLKLVNEVNGSYCVLVKVTLDPAAALKSISFDTITAINSHTQPTLHLGKNTVYVGDGDQSESIVFWPELQKNGYKPYVVDEKNMKSDDKNEDYYGTLHPDKNNQEGYVTFKIDAPTDLTSVTYGGRLYNRGVNNHIDFLHSFDNGKTWTKDYSLTDTNPPWDVIHYVTLSDIPAGTHSVLFKYLLYPGPDGGCSLYALRMEADHKLAQPSNEPVEVTFKWQERQKDYSTISRSHTEIVDKLPATYTIDVGGYDQPIVDSLTINLKGSRPDVKAGYSDGKDVGGEKFVGVWASYGHDLAAGKPYTVSVPCEKDQWGASDPNLKKLTDGVVGPSYTNYAAGAIWKPNANPEITVDLGESQKIAAFRIHTLGYEYKNAMQGQNKDKVEVLTSTDGKQFTSAGFIDQNLRWKDLPVNFMYPDDENFGSNNYFFAPPAPVEARYVKYKITSSRFFGCTEVQVLDSYDIKPFDLKIALPDPAKNGQAPPKADLSPNAKKWSDSEKCTTIGQEQHWK